MLAGERSRPYFFAKVRLPTGSPDEMNSVMAAYKMLLARWCSSFIENPRSDLVRRTARRQKLVVGRGEGGPGGGRGAGVRAGGGRGPIGPTRQKNGLLAGR